MGSDTNVITKLLGTRSPTTHNVSVRQYRAAKPIPVRSWFSLHQLHQNRFWLTKEWWIPCSVSINPTFQKSFQKGNVHHSDVSFLRQISNGLPFLFVGHRIINGTLDSHFSRAVTLAFWRFPPISFLCSSVVCWGFSFALYLLSSSDVSNHITPTPQTAISSLRSGRSGNRQKHRVSYGSGIASPRCMVSIHPGSPYH